MDKLVEEIKNACIEEQEIWETDAPVTDGTEDINEGRAEFAGQILRLIKKASEPSPVGKDGYTIGPGPLDGSKKMTMKEMPSAVQLQWTGTHAYKNKKKYGFDSPEWKNVVEANNARNEESASGLSGGKWAPGAIDRSDPDA